jgi:hypothetical protein
MLAIFRLWFDLEEKWTITQNYCVLHIRLNTTIFHLAVQYVYNYMFPPCMLAIFRLWFVLEEMCTITKNFCVLHIKSNTTIFHLVVQEEYNYMFRSCMWAIFRLWFDLEEMWTITKNFCVLHNTVEHNYISSSNKVGIQLHVSALYVGHLQVVIWLSEQLYKMCGVL